MVIKVSTQLTISCNPSNSVLLKKRTRIVILVRDGEPLSRIFVYRVVHEIRTSSTEWPTWRMCISNNSDRITLYGLGVTLSLRFHFIAMASGNFI